MGPSLASLFVVLLLACGVVGTSSHTQDLCPCADIEGCRRPLVSGEHDKEIFVFTAGNGVEHHEKWDWGSITTAITTHDYDESNYWVLMCYAHRKNARFGFTKKVTTQDLNETKVNAWMDGIVNTAHHTRADIVALDLTPYFLEQGGTMQDKNQNISTLVQTIKDLSKNLQPNVVYVHPVRIMCIAPWLPPGDGTEVQPMASSLGEACHFFLLNPDSFAINFDLNCQARATMPLPRMVISVEEYIASGIESNRLILGIPWHGYEYTCAKLDQDICKLSVKTEGTTSACAIQDRKKVTLVEIFSNYKDSFAFHNRSRFDGAPYFNTKEGPKQVWFEDSHSLKIKYHIAHDLELKGIAIMTAEDLNDYSNPTVVGYEQEMWSWAFQTYLYKSPTRPQEKPIAPGTVAGAAIGCLVAGIFLGIIFTCLALRRTVTKPRPPFLKDHDEYHDEDPNL